MQRLSKCIEQMENEVHEALAVMDAKTGKVLNYWQLLQVSCLLRVLDASQFLYFSYNLLYCMHDFVCMCDGWVGNSFVLEIYCVVSRSFLVALMWHD